MSKKAISPLIGAVLIIGFTVALAAVVMFWSSGFIKSTTTTTGEKVTEQVTLLRDLTMNVRDATTNLTDSTVKIKVENKNEKKIEGFIVKIHGANSTFTNDSVDVSLEPFEIKYIIVGYDSSIGNITKIEVIPRVIVEQKEIAATLQSDEFIAPAITGATPTGEYVADANTVLLFHFDKDAADEGEAKEYSYDPSMVGWWHLNDTSDSSGNGNDGTPINGASVTTSGRFGNAYSLDGVNDYINVSDNDNLDITGTNSKTITAWVYYNKLTNSAMVVSKWNSGASGAGWQINYNAGTDPDKFQWWGRNAASDDWNIIENTASFTTGTWYFVAVVVDGSSLKLYKDGVELKATVTGSALDTSNSLPLQMGVRGDTAHPANGTIDEVAIYNRTLSATEIAKQAGLIAKDYSTYGNNATLFNGVNWNSSGKIGSGLEFDGEMGNNFVEVLDSPSLDANALTMEGWFYHRTGGQADQYLITKNGNSYSNEWSYAMRFTSGDTLAVYLSSDGSTPTASTATPSISYNAWHHLAATYDGVNTVKIYVDGELKVTSTAFSGSIYKGSGDLHIGARGDGTGSLYNFNGTIDEVRISNIAREF